MQVQSRSMRSSYKKGTGGGGGGEGGGRGRRARKLRGKAAYTTYTAKGLAEGEQGQEEGLWKRAEGEGACAIQTRKELLIG